MKIYNSIYSDFIRRLLLMVPVICSMAFSACSGVAGTAQTNVRVNFQKAVTGKPQTGDNVTIPLPNWIEIMKLHTTAATRTLLRHFTRMMPNTWTKEELL
jgi:hypothetical protein